MNVSPSLPEEPSFSLIFVNYRSGRYLAQALESLFRVESGEKFEVIVVNNDSQEEALLASLRRYFPFQLLKSDQNLGYGGGINRGVQIASGKYFGFLNPDILWQQAVLKDISGLFQGSPRLGVLGLALLDRQGIREAWSGGEDVALWQILKNNLFPLRFRAPREGRQERGNWGVIEWTSGGAMFVPREVFQTVGGFDERFFLYFEDVDFCRRVRAQGYLVGTNPELTLLHYGGKSQSSPLAQKQSFFTSQEKYFQKYFSPTEYQALRFLRFLRYGF